MNNMPTKEEMLKVIGKAVSIEQSLNGRHVTSKEARRFVSKALKKEPWEKWVEVYNQSVRCILSSIKMKNQIKRKK